MILKIFCMHRQYMWKYFTEDYVRSSLITHFVFSGLNWTLLIVLLGLAREPSRYCRSNYKSNIIYFDNVLSSPFGLNWSNSSYCSLKIQLYLTDLVITWRHQSGNDFKTKCFFYQYLLLIMLASTWSYQVLNNTLSFQQKNKKSYKWHSRPPPP